MNFFIGLKESDSIFWCWIIFKLGFSEYEMLKETKFIIEKQYKIDLNKREYMFELGLIYPEYNRYKSWNKLINKITSV